MTTRAAQIECLLTPVIDHRTNSVASGYTAYFYAAGTSNAKNVWTEKEKTNPYTSRTLGSDGTIQVYGDGVYKITVKDTDATTVHEWDNVKVQANTFTVQSKSDTYTATADDDVILCSGTFTVNLSDVAGFTHPLVIKRVSGTITVDPYGAQTIDGNATITLTADVDSAVLYPDTTASVWRRADRLAGLTATISELNTLDGITATVAELNTLDGITADVNELNILDGVTAFLDEDSFASNSATAMASQQSIAAYIATVIATYNESSLKKKIVSIGDWNMDANDTKTVAHGLTMANIRAVSGIVRDDGNNNYYPLLPGRDTSAAQFGGVNISYVNSTNVVLYRATGGTFDSATFDATSYNRGWLVIEYV